MRLEVKLESSPQSDKGDDHFLDFRVYGFCILQNFASMVDRLLDSSFFSNQY